MNQIQVAAIPYPYQCPLQQTALVVIDMQRDFIEEGGFGSVLGNNVRPLAAIVPVVAQLLALARRHGLLVVHTRESHLPDLSDCPPAKLRRGNPFLAIGDAGPMGRILVRGEAGNQILAAVAPQAAELVIDKPGKGAFYGTDLQQQLQSRGITHLLFAGVDPQFGIHRVVKAIKGRSSFLLRSEFRTLRTRLPSLWTNSYFVATTGGAPLAVIKRYIERQKEV